MADNNGTAYIFNMCDQPVTITLNSAADPSGQLDKIGTASPFTPSSHTAPRFENPQPFEVWQFGGSLNASTNVLTWYLGTDKSETRSVKLSLTQTQSHIENPCQIYLFYDAAVLRWAGNSTTVPASIG